MIQDDAKFQRVATAVARVGVVALVAVVARVAVVALVAIVAIVAVVALVTRVCGFAAVATVDWTAQIRVHAAATSPRTNAAPPEFRATTAARRYFAVSSASA